MLTGGEPEGIVRPLCYASQVAAQRQQELGTRSLCGNLPDTIGFLLNEKEARPIIALDYASQLGIRGRCYWKRCKGCGGGESKWRGLGIRLESIIFERGFCLFARDFAFFECDL